MEHEKKHADLLEQYLKHAELITQPNTNVELNYCQLDGRRLPKTMTIILLTDVTSLLKNEFVVEKDKKTCKTYVTTG
jgi:hypothetical protein